MVETNDSGVLGWDSVGFDVPESEYETLEPGLAKYTITNFERAHHPGSAKLPAGPMAKVTFEVTDGHKTARVFENFILNVKMMFKITPFFKSTGLVDVNTENGNYPMHKLWDEIVGRQGICMVGTREHNGKTYNSITKFIYNPTPEEDAQAATIARTLAGETQTWGGSF